MLIEVALKTYLSQPAAITDLLGSSAACRIYPLVMPQAVTYPAVTYQRISAVRDRATRGHTGATFARFQFDCWAAATSADGGGYMAAKGVADAIRRSVDGYRGAMGSSTVGTLFVQDVTIENDRDEYDPDARLYRVGFDLGIWYSEQVG